MVTRSLSRCFSSSPSRPVSTRALATLMLAVSTVLMACHSKKRSTEAIPPIGYFATRAEAEKAADQANADLARSRAVQKSAGVPERGLPCGQYTAVSRNDSDGHAWWTTERDMSGCPKPELAPLSQPQSKGGQPK